MRVLAAALPLVAATLLTLYVLGEDPVRGGGISRWDAYRSPGGALGPMFACSVGLMVGLGATLAYAGIRGSARLAPLGALVAGVVVLVLLTATYLGFSVE